MYSENDNLKLFPTERKRSYPKCIGLVFFLISKQPKITRIRGSSILSRMNYQTPTWVRGEEYFISEYTSLNRLCIKWQLQETKLQHAWWIAYKMSINLRCWMKIFIQYTYLHVHVLERRGGLYYVILHRKLYLHVQDGTSYIYIIYKF